MREAGDVLRRFAIALAALVVALATVTAAPDRAHAVCTCSATTAEQGMDDASVVFLGSLMEISNPTAEGLVSLGFDVRLVYKGEVGVAAELTTFAKTEDCGFGDTARRGEWLVFATTFAGPDAGPPLLTTCSPSGPLTSTSVLPVELGQGRAPPGAEEYVPVVAGAPLDTYLGEVTDPEVTARRIATALAIVVGVGIAARLLAGRRRTVVR